MRDRVDARVRDCVSQSASLATESAKVLSTVFSSSMVGVAVRQVTGE